VVLVEVAWYRGSVVVCVCGFVRVWFRACVVSCVWFRACVVSYVWGAFARIMYIVYNIAATTLALKRSERDGSSKKERARRVTRCICGGE
jgi:hypothetical protein